MKYLKYFKESNVYDGWIYSTGIRVNIKSDEEFKKSFDYDGVFQYELYYGNEQIILTLQEDTSYIKIYNDYDSGYDDYKFDLELNESIINLREFKLLLEICVKTRENWIYINKLLDVIIPKDGSGDYDVPLGYDYWDYIKDYLLKNFNIDSYIIEKPISQHPHLFNDFEDLEKFNNAVDKIREECDHLLSGIDMGLL